MLGNLWGGKFSCIIPTDQTCLNNELELSWIKKFSPDIIICSSDQLDPATKKIIGNNTDPPFQILTLSENYEENLRFLSSQILTLEALFQQYAKEVNALPDIRNKYQFVSTTRDIKNKIFYNLSFGVTSKEYCNNLAKILSATAIHKTEWSIKEYIELHRNRANPFSFWDISGSALTTINSFGEAPTIFVLSRSVVDYSWFWNNRYKFLAGNNGCVAIPVDSIEQIETITSLAEWLIECHSKRSNFCQIKSISADKASLQTMARKLRPRLRKYGFKHVDVVYEEKPSIPNMYVQHHKYDIEASWFDAVSFKFNLPTLSFNEEIRDSDSGRWVLEIEGGDKLKGHNPSIVSFKTNTLILNTPSSTSPNFQFIGHSRRYYSGNIAISVKKNQSFYSFTLPSIAELLSPYFKSIKIKEIQDEKRRCYESVFELFGGLNHFSTCCNDLRYSILSSFWSEKYLPCENLTTSLSKGCPIKQSDIPFPVTLNEIKNRSKIGKDLLKPFSKSIYHSFIKNRIMLDTLASRHNAEKDFYRSNTPQSFISWLVKQRITRRILRYPECMLCGNKCDWVSKVDLEQQLICTRCGNEIPFPNATFDIGYQANPLVYRAFKEGIRPVALTLSVLADASRRGFMYIPGYKGSLNDTKFDIDIIAICNGHLVFCECKNMENVPSKSRDWSTVKHKFEQLIEIASYCGANSVVLASLADDYPVSIHRIAKNKTTNQLRVVLLSKNDLIRGHTLVKDPDVKFRRAFFEEYFISKSKIKKNKSKRIISYGLGTAYSD